MEEYKPDKTLAAACGLFCPSCSIYIATKEDPERLKRISETLNMNIEEAKCNGCRSEKRNANCNKCVMYKCTQEKGIDFCVYCDDYPCRELKEFQSFWPHRIELWKDLEKIKIMGYEKWFTETYDNYKCKNCNTINSGWDIKCRKCGHMPGSNYIENNISEIKKRME
jgi:hypothetical protein